MQHTKVSEVQCFEISCNRKVFGSPDFKGTHRTTDCPRFLVDSIAAQDKIRLGTYSLGQG